MQLINLCIRYLFHRDKRTRDHYTPSHSRSISRSVSPRDDKEYRSNRQSVSPNRNGKSPNDKDHHGSDQRSARLRNNDVSPHGDDYSPDKKRDPELVRKEINARKDDHNLPRSTSKSRNRSRSPSYRYPCPWFYEFDVSLKTSVVF